MSDRSLVTSGHLAIIWVRGRDTASFLDGLLSQSIAAIPIGGTARSLLLAPNGKLRAILFVLRGKDRVGLVCDSSIAALVAQDLGRFKIRVDAEIIVDPGLVFEAWGEAARDIAGVPAQGSWTQDETGIRFAMGFARSALDRVIWMGEGGEAPSPESPEFEALRIELGEPIVGVDLDEKTIPQEAVPVTEYVDFTKGCYLGQELVARIDSRGHVNRRLTGLVIAAEDPVPRDAEVFFEDRLVGAATSSAWSSALDTVVAMAMIRTEVAAGSAVTVAGAAAELVDLPITS